MYIFITSCPNRRNDVLFYVVLLCLSYAYIYQFVTDLE